MQQGLLQKSTARADGEEQLNILSRCKKGHGKIIYVDSCDLVIQGQETLGTNYDDEHKSFFICHINKTTVNQERVKCWNGLYTVDDDVEFTFKDMQFNATSRPCYYRVDDIHKPKSKRKKKTQNSKRDKNIPPNENRFFQCPCCHHKSKYEINENIEDDGSERSLRSRLLYEINYLWMMGMLTRFFDGIYDEYYEKLPYKSNFPERRLTRLQTMLKMAGYEESPFAFNTRVVEIPIMVLTKPTNSGTDQVLHEPLIPNEIDTKASGSSKLVYDNQAAKPVPPETPSNISMQNSEAAGGAHPKVYSSVPSQGPSASPDAETSDWLIKF